MDPITRSLSAQESKVVLALTELRRRGRRLSGCWAVATKPQTTSSSPCAAKAGWSGRPGESICWRRRSRGRTRSATAISSRSPAYRRSLLHRLRHRSGPLRADDPAPQRDLCRDADSTARTRGRRVTSPDRQPVRQQVLRLRADRCPRLQGDDLRPRKDRHRLHRPPATGRRRGRGRDYPRDREPPVRLEQGCGLSRTHKFRSACAPSRLARRLHQSRCSLPRARPPAAARRTEPQDPPRP